MITGPDGRSVAFGLKTEPSRATASELLAIWRGADAIEAYRDIWLFDHFVPLRMEPDGPCLEAWTMLTALGVQTRRIRIGVMVLGNTYRHPAVLANMATTLDIVTDGRLELGLGAGWHEGEHAMYGIPLPPMADRIRAMGEACEVLKGLWTQPRTTFEGRYYRLTDAVCEPKPVQSPHPPITIGGKGEKLTLRAVARHADRWNYNGRTVEEFVRLDGILDEHCAAVGRDPTAIERSVQLHVTEDADATRALVEAYVAAGATHVLLNPRIPLRRGIAEHVASEVIGRLG